VQRAKNEICMSAGCDSGTICRYGKVCISNEAQGVSGASTTGGSAWGASVAKAAQDSSSASTHNELGDFRANGCKAGQGSVGKLC
jgi:hypothetical protein